MADPKEVMLVTVVKNIIFVIVDWNIFYCNPNVGIEYCNRQKYENSVNVLYILGECLIVCVKMYGKYTKKTWYDLHIEYSRNATLTFCLTFKLDELVIVFSRLQFQICHSSLNLN